LVAPNNTVNNDIVVLVWVSAGDDLEFAMPTGEKVNRMRISNAANPARSTDLVVPQAEEVAAQQTSLVDATNHVHFGESIRSFRQMLKRYTRHETFGMPIATTRNDIRVQRSVFPYFPGFYTAASSNILKPATGGPYAYGHTTLLTYISSAFVGWRGAVRVLVDANSLACCKSVTSLFATRYSGCQPTSTITVSTGDKDDQVKFYDDGTGLEGGMIMSPQVNPTLSFEVPYYSEYRFSLSRQAPGFDTNGPFNVPCWKILATTEAAEASGLLPIGIFYAAGEDFTPFFYIGPPPLYYEAIPPTV
jgi:hypothetical protein